MKTKFKGILTLILVLLVQVAFAQEKTISGTVSDGSGPLPGVTVLIKGTAKGTQTDFDGKYQISTKKGDVIVFSFIGMKTTSVTVGDSNLINVSMQEDANLLEEVIVVAYGTAKKSDYTGAATQINSDDIGNRALANVTSALEGASAGVSVTAASGQPGEGQDIRIRGFGSVGASSSPLYVVDGMIYYGDISAINSNDIESLTVLKDASSTSLYGNKAANGVVMITTKKGRSAEGQFSLNVSSSIVDRSIKEYDRLNADQYYPAMWESLRNSIAVPGVATDAAVTAANQTASNTIYNQLLNNPYNVANDQIVGVDGKLNPSAQLLYPDDLDWSDAITRLGNRQNYDLSYQGGTEKSDFYASLGYLNEEGYIKNSDFERISGRINLNYQANKWLKTGLNIGATTSTGNQSQATDTQSSSFVNPIRFTRGIGPIYNIYQHDASGAYILDDNGDRIYDLLATRPSGASGGRHIVAEIDWNDDIDEKTSLSGKTYFDIKLMEGLVFTTNVSFDQRNIYNTTFWNKTVGDGAPGGLAARTYNRRTSVGFNQLLNYSKSIGNHNFSALVAHESLDLRINVLDGTKRGIIADGNTELINFVTTTDLRSYEDNLNDESYFGRLNYDFNGKYFLSSSFRTDGSSKFSKDTRWGQFWSLGGAWRLDKESFMGNQKWIDLMKLRASYGELGNNSGISFYAYQGLYNLDYNNQAESGYILGTLEAPNLQWETSASYDIAVEFGLFEKLNGTIEYFKRESANLLFDVPLPLSSGSESIPQNIGTMYNKGIEVSLDFDVLRNDNFKWNIGLNASTIDNKFTKLPQEEIVTGSKKYMVGKSIYDYWLKDWHGVDPTDGAALYVANEDAVTANGADIRTIDGNVLTTNQANAEYHYAGSAIPDLTGSISNSISYKNFNLGFLFTYQIGGETLDYNYQAIMSAGTYGTALSKDILDRWQQPGDITNIPRLDASQTTNFNATSDRWLVDASYLNLKQISLSYGLPKEVLTNLGISTAQLYVSSENVFSLNARKGMNIQQEFNGTTSNIYTPSRIVSLGLNVKF
ncbi:TonB-dependent receptor [Lutibacter sp.]|uniref:SusC/RagA family TonB-linked outer membrane protein n=1 Tax=Lutibacter sp. TaxID=1925666 RepID=UPI001A1CBF4C|nr:TonB-dependent receptor [Lutibacter sp.]MBI9040776.1 TonB-dependent receptor [Lutibacter sp.]